MVKNNAAFEDPKTLQAKILELLDGLPTVEHGQWIARSLATLLRIAHSDVERLDWKILTYALQDMEQGFEIFYPYRHVRKITIFGSARTPRDRPEYDLAVRFARRMTEYGFMIITGAGGGIMQAGNEGATTERSFGLNIQLPFEQTSNPFIEGDPKSINFKYFFTRKLFFLKESDALALFPGGFGTQDETFESLTLSQTGKYGPAPIVLIDRPGGHYWKDWDEYIHRQLLARGLISDYDSSLYTITDNLDVACEAIRSFYRVYHSSRYVGEQLAIRLKCELSDEDVEYLNANFSDLLIKGRIEKSPAFPQELNDETMDLPRLALYFNQRDLGRLYQLIATINQLGCQSPESEHPEQK
ncbi:LOG family protein [Oscillatoriales cyanobacterium LEGE 11467]|uniref:LOG family protein n=1 Tax=Zarconia navalis LEGE 11467 TaxID=1828826 RepID=A0A928Z8Y6_9CYAN|nr:LOG family protein [Zarconia navalis]MBE9041168.1 LOG family protein [Zarconia navalis LEGE 11467]